MQQVPDVQQLDALPHQDFPQQSAVVGRLVAEQLRRLVQRPLASEHQFGILECPQPHVSRLHDQHQAGELGGKLPYQIEAGMGDATPRRGRAAR